MVRIPDGDMVLTNLLLLLLSNAVSLRRDKSILYSRTSAIIFITILIISLYCINLLYVGDTISLYGGLFNISSTSFMFHMFIYALSIIIIILSSIFSRKDLFKILKSINFNKFIANNKNDHFKILEYPLILLFIIVGATFLISSSDVVSLFICIELQSYGLYLLVVLYRNSELSTNAGLTYFLLGGLSSCFILLGTSLLYTNSGTTSFELLYIINKVWDASKNYILFSFETNYLHYALIVMIAGFLFKVSAAPFHFWSPDVYDAIPTIVTTFVAIIPKISVLIFVFTLVRFTTNTTFSYSQDWRYILLISSLLSLIVGTVLGLNQTRIKRLFAYSTISHLGFILLALSINSIESTQAFIFYLMQYSLSNLNAFILLLGIGYSLYLYRAKKLESELKESKNSPLQLISQLKGYFVFNPIIAISLTITIYSFVGVPPLVGFFAKQMVLSAALDNGFVFMSLIAILTSVIGAVYYLYLLKQIIMDEFIYSTDKRINKVRSISSIRLSTYYSVIISILTLVILLFMLQCQEWLSMIHILSFISFNI